MFQLNNLQRNVLITPAEVIFHADSDHTLDARKIENSIIIAEERFMREALTYELYEEMIATKNVVVTDANKAELQAKIDLHLPAKHKPVNLVNGDIVNSPSFLSSSNLKLWKMYAWKLASECVMISATPGGFVQFGNTGVAHAQPTSQGMIQSGAVTPSLSAVKWSMDKKLQDRIGPLMQAMHTFICQNRVNYLNYSKPCDCDASGVAYKKKTDWVTGLYDNNDETCGCYE